MQETIQKQFFTIIGRPGSGKGTQSELLKRALIDKGVNCVTHITTGGSFRDFITGNTYMAKLARNVNDTGGLQPEFLAVWNWSNIFIQTLQGNETIILDGAPRKPFEINVLHSAITFLGYQKPIVIYLDASESVSRAHLTHRGREDDKIESNVARRMGWFETEVLPTLNAYLSDPRYTVLHINGDQTIEEVHKEIIKKLEAI